MSERAIPVAIGPRVGQRLRQLFEKLRPYQDYTVLLEAAELIERLQSQPSESSASADTKRLDWLETMTVNVRVPRVHGSRDLFWASPEQREGEEDRPSTLRTSIDISISERE